MASVQTRYNYGNQHELEQLPMDEFEQAQHLCDYPEQDEEDENQPLPSKND